jgi:hypothetical protein
MFLFQTFAGLICALGLLGNGLAHSLHRRDASSCADRCQELSDRYTSICNSLVQPSDLRSCRSNQRAFNNSCIEHCALYELICGSSGSSTLFATITESSESNAYTEYSTVFTESSSTGTAEPTETSIFGGPLEIPAPCCYEQCQEMSLRYTATCARVRPFSRMRRCFAARDRLYEGCQGACDQIGIVC